MGDVKALEQQYLDATRLSALDIPRAKAALSALRNAGADPSLVVMYEARTLQLEYPERRDDAMRMLIAHIADDNIVDPTVAARICIVASRLAMLLYDRTALEYVMAYANRLWPMHSDNYEVMRWRPGVELNAGILYLRIGRSETAIAHFDEMLATYDQTPANFCWRTQINMYLAVLHARSGNVAVARTHAEQANQTRTAPEEAQYYFVLGEIALAEKRYDDARSLLRKAYTIAKQWKEPVIMADSQIALCHVYKENRNYDAFWYAYERASDVATSNGMIHVLDALARISVDVPNN